jgi:hypothetical protein
VLLALSGRAEIPATLPSDKREKYQEWRNRDVKDPPIAKKISALNF